MVFMPSFFDYDFSNDGVQILLLEKKQRFLPNRPFEKEKWKHNETNNLSSPKLAEWDAHLSYKCFSLYMYKNADNLNVVVEDSNANGVELKVCV